MSSKTSEVESRFIRIQGRTSRTQSVATRFTCAEEKDLLACAESSGQNLREWAREVLLREAKSKSDVMSGEALLTEIIGLQLFLTNALMPLMCGEKITAKQYEELLHNVKINKHRATREVIAQYVSTRQENDHA